MGQPLYRIAALRAAEHEALAQLPPGTLMRRAGEAAAAVIAARLRPRSRIAVVCGPGNNGGDGWICASALKRAGHLVAVWPLDDAPPATADARAAQAGWLAGAEPVATAPPAGRFDLVVDALFGIGIARALDERARAAVAWINASAAPVVALDVPSGLDADRGTWIGGCPGVLADLTLTFLGDKPGLHTGTGVVAAGEVVVESLGLALPASPLALAGPEDFDAVCRPRNRAAHKGCHGSVAIVGGAPGMLGAALLAGRAALRLGAGRVYLELLDERAPSVDPLAPELMLRAPPERAIQACVFGCGAGTDARARTRWLQALQAPAPLVLDADGLNLFAAADPALPGLGALAARGAPTVLTPHPLEAARLLQVEVAAIQDDRMAHAQALAQASGAIVVLKGAGTVVADGTRTWVNPSGSPALATAGTGDVLAGMIGALLAQGYPAIQAVLAAVWLHGAAAEDHGDDLGLLASEVAALAARRLGRLRRGGSGGLRGL